MKTFFRYKEIIKQYVLNLVTLIVFWGTLIRSNFNADTLSRVSAADADVYSSIQNGRYPKALFDWLMLKVGFKTTDCLPLQTILCILLVAVILVLLQRLFSQWEPQKLFFKIGYYSMISLVFFSVLFSENLMFVECSVSIIFAYVFAQIGINFFARKRYGWGIFWLFLGTIEYQYSMIYASVVLAFYFMYVHKAKWSLKAVRDEIVSVFVCCGMGAVDWLLIKFQTIFGIEEFVTNTGDVDYLSRIKPVLLSIINYLKSSFGLLPGVWLQLLLIVGVMVILGISFRKEISRLLYVLVVIVGSIILTYAIPFIELYFYFPGRVAFIMYATLGLLLASVFVFADEKVYLASTCVFLGYFLIQLVFVGFQEASRFATNRLDILNAEMVMDKIENYETETGINVKNMGVCHDPDASYYYDHIGYQYEQINERASTWVPRPLLLYYSGRWFNPVEMDEQVFEEYFEGKDWKVPNMEEQLIIIGDTAYWCLY